MAATNIFFGGTNTKYVSAGQPTSTENLLKHSFNMKNAYYAQLLQIQRNINTAVHALVDSLDNLRWAVIIAQQFHFLTEQQ